MPLFVDHVGLNTIISEEITPSTNTRGTFVNRTDAPGPRDSAIEGKINSDIRGSLVSPTSGYPTSGAIGFSFWVNLNNIANNSSQRYVMMATDAGSNVSFLIQFSDTGQLYFKVGAALGSNTYIYGEKGTSENPSNFINQFIGQWKHVYFAWDGNFSNPPVLTVDGNVEPSVYTDGSLTGAAGYLATLGFRFFNAPTTDRALEGRLQSFSIYKTSLPAASALFNGGVPPNSNMPSPTTNLLDFWLFGNEPQFLNSPFESNLFNVPTTGFGQFCVVLSTSGTVGTNLTASGPVFLQRGYPSDHAPTTTVDFPSINFVGRLSGAANMAGLNTHRNGPYGYSSWRQQRVSDNPITRYHIANSTMTFVTEPGDLVALSGGVRVRTRYSRIHRYQEPVIAQKGYPLVWNVGRHFKDEDGQLADQPQKFSMMSSYANQQIGFANEQVDKLLKYDPDEEQTEYVAISNMYLENGLNKQDSPLTYWEFLQYRETVYPHMKNQFQNENMERPEFKSYFRHKRSDRNETRDKNSYSFDPADGSITNLNPNNILDFGNRANNITQSSWVLDAGTNFLTELKSVNDNIYMNADTSFESPKRTRGAGLLLSTVNTYAREIGAFTNELSSSIALNVASASVALDVRLTPGPVYTRRISLLNTSSVAAPSGMFIPQTGGLDVNVLFEGNALWEAGATREIKDVDGNYVSAPRTPFFDTYENYIEEAKRRYKNFSVVPEFRMSTQIEDYLTTNTAIELDMFEVTGGVSGSSNSSEGTFYEIYSNSDFMRNFEVINDDHKDFTNGKVLSLRCKAVKKFLPYEGFYPAQRTADLAERFYNSFKDNIALFSNEGIQINDFNYGSQVVMTPLFAPGILFNTIKSGVAVDYPVITGSTTDFRAFVGSHFEHYINNDNFDTRIPFEAIVEPNRFLNVSNFASNEPHPSGNLSSSAVWDGQGDELYSKMANNFMAEVPSFFLPNGQLTSIVSKKQEDITLTEGAVYGMRIKMRRSMNSTREKVFHKTSEGQSYFPPQDVGRGSAAPRENFTMYSRPSAFGPPSAGGIIWASSGSGRTLHTFNDNHNFELYEDYYASSVALYIDSTKGYNFPFTPPYYHGEAWCEIVLTASSPAMTIRDIQESASYTYKRFDDSFYDFTDSNNDPGAVSNAALLYGPQAGGPRINNNAVQLSASLNIKGIGTIQMQDGRSAQGNLIVDTAVGSESRWVIQTKFETPMLNFNHISAASGNLGIPAHASESVPRGMWHQYGRIPEESEGVFLEVGAIEQNYWNQARGENVAVEDLAAALGFAGSSTKIGRLAESKRISECVVAVPFIEKEGRKKFFRLALSEDQLQKFNAGDIDSLTTGPAQSQIGRSVLLQLDKMKRFVFPPSFDFLKFPDVDPIAMYVFEFTHVLSQQDLSDIWQNLPPDIGVTMEESEVAITHPLLQKELLGEGGEEGNQLIDMPNKLRWMVFKVKQRAASNYFKKTVLRNPQVNVDVEDGDVVKDEFGDTSPIQYNWPYDYFSLVELVKIDSEVELGNFSEADISNYTDNLPGWEGVEADMDKIEYIVGGLEDNPIAEFQVEEPEDNRYDENGILLDQYWAPAMLDKFINEVYLYSGPGISVREGFGYLYKEYFVFTQNFVGKYSSPDLGNYKTGYDANKGGIQALIRNFGQEVGTDVYGVGVQAGATQQVTGLAGTSLFAAEERRRQAQAAAAARALGGSSNQEEEVRPYQEAKAYALLRFRKKIFADMKKGGFDTFRHAKQAWNTQGTVNKNYRARQARRYIKTEGAVIRDMNKFPNLENYIDGLRKTDMKWVDGL